MKTVLFVLVSFLAVTALLSGIMLISNPDGKIMNLSVSLLEGTPFKDFTIPGVLLAVLVGGTNLLAVFFNRCFSLVAGLLSCYWNTGYSHCIPVKRKMGCLIFRHV